MKKAILYTRVSTEERAKKGFSLGEQLHDLRGQAARQGYAVLEEVEDPGYSRSTLNRPGMDRVRELVAGGGVDAVIAWKRDRYGAAPWPGVLEVEFAASGCALRALDDSGEGDDAEFMGGIKDLMAKRELRDMVRRTRMGKAGKARSGKVLGSGPPPYGYRYVVEEGKRAGLAVDEATMPVVRRLFELVGDRGVPMYAAGRKLEAEGHPAPKGGPWRVSVIKSILERDAYRPHTADELRAAGVSEDVLSRLDPDAPHGVSFFGKRRATGPARGPRTYRALPREEWIAVPVPDAGVPLAWVEAARESVRDNPRPAFGGGGRDHELAGGVLTCAECGHGMTTYNSKAGGKSRWYYACPAARTRSQGNVRERCAHRRMHNAGALEAEVVALVDGELLCDRERLATHLDAAIERERAAFGRRLGSAGAVEVWHKALADAGQEMDALVRLYTTGRLRGGEADFDRRAAEIDARRSAAEGEIARLTAAGSRVEEMEAARRAVLEMWGTGLSLGIFWMPPRLKRQVYGLLGLRVALDAGGTLTLEGSFDADLMRLTPEVEAWVAGLREIDGRLRAEHAADQAEGLDRLEAELAGLRRRMGVRAAGATSGCA